MSYLMEGTCGVTFGSHYRAPSEIRADMRVITRKIESMEEKLNLHDALLALATESANPEKLIGELEEIVGEADDTLRELHSLEEDLRSLGEELSEAKAAFGEVRTWA